MSPDSTPNADADADPGPKVDLNARHEHALEHRDSA